VAGRLVAALGPTLVSTLAGATDPHAATAWTAPSAALSADADSKLRLADRAVRAISQTENIDVARSWFIAANALLDDTSPVEAIRVGRHRDVVAALNALVTDTWVG
jgi:hypothetical protein